MKILDEKKQPKTSKEDPKKNDSWKMDVCEFEENGCLINFD
jgi:hypothetical protein